MGRAVSAGGDIANSVVVTGDGNSVSLSFGGAFVLPLHRRQIAAPKRPRRAAGFDPLPLLAADAETLTFVGRDAQIADLRAWLDGDADISVRGLIARAGTGKTRLAVELCRAIDPAREAGTQGWVAGFVRPSDLEALVDQMSTRRLDWARNTLIVLDYAAAAHKALARWLDWLVAEAFPGKLRILLLDREAPEGFGWWHELTRAGDGGEVTRRDLFDAERPESLGDLGEQAWRRRLCGAALAASAGLLGDKAKATALPPEGAIAQLDSALAEPRFGNPLNLAMAGIIAAERGPVEATGLRRLSAARHLAEHERRRMVHIACSERIGERAMEHALGFNGIAGGLPVEDLAPTLAAELASVGLSGESAAIADLFLQEFPQPEQADGEAAEAHLGTIQPDLIGEAVIVETLLTPHRERAAAKVVERAYALTGGRAAEALMRLIQDYGYAVEDPQASAKERATGAIVLQLLEYLAEAIPDEEIGRLETLVFAFPHDTTVLREAAAKQTGRLVQLWRAIVAMDDGELPRTRLSLWVHNLGNRLSDLGRREEALTTAEEAVALYRTLAAARPDAFTPNLAMSLSNLANRLSDLGRREEALTAAEEAVALFRALAAAHPDAFASDLAMSLNNLANRLSDLGHREEALTAAEESVALRRALAAARPDAFTPDLAMSLSNLATFLSELGRREEALTAAEEAVALRRALAAVRPDAFTPNLAASLNNLANFLSELGHREEALTAAEEAVALRRALVAARPDAFTPDLAMSLLVLGDRLEELGRVGEAVSFDHASVTALRPYFLRHPVALAGPMASYLRDYVRRAEAAGVELDFELIGPIAEVLGPMLKEPDS